MNAFEKLYIKIYDEYIEDESSNKLEEFDIPTPKTLKNGEYSISSRKELRNEINRLDDYANFIKCMEIGTLSEEYFKENIVQEFVRDCEVVPLPIVQKVIEDKSFVKSKFEHILKLRNDDCFLFEYESYELKGKTNYVYAYDYKDFSEFGFDSGEIEKIDLDKATNVYERLLIQFFNTYISFYDVNNVINTARRIIYDQLIGSKLDSKEELIKLIQILSQDMFLYDKPYVDIISYKKTDKQDMYREHFNFAEKATHRKLEQLKVAGERTLLPLDLSNFEYIKDEVDEHLVQAVYQAVYESVNLNIEHSDNMLGVKATDGDYEYVLIAHGALE